MSELTLEGSVILLVSSTVTLSGMNVLILPVAKENGMKLLTAFSKAFSTNGTHI